MTKPTCNDLLSKGICLRSNCTGRHDVVVCATCRVVFSVQAELSAHLKGSKHLKRVNNQSQPARCTVCEVDIHMLSHYAIHSTSRLHRANLEKGGFSQDPGPEELESSPLTKRCETCHLFVSRTSWQSHINGKRHRRATGYVALKGALEHAESDKNGIWISEGESGLDFGLVDIGSSTAAVKRQLSIQNTNATRVTLIATRMASRQTARAQISPFQLHQVALPLHILAHRTGIVTVGFDSGGRRGRYQDRIELIFEDPSIKQTFAIVRPICAIFGTKEDHDLLRPTAPYVRPKRTPEEPMREVIAGISPPAILSIKWKVKLPPYPMIQGLVEVAYGMGTTTELARNVKDTFMPGSFNENMYGRHFKVLLFIEEERARRDLQQYSMSNVPMDPVNTFYKLRVDGLAEKRPSVIVTDVIYVRPHGSDSDKWYQGHVHRVEETNVFLRFARSFSGFSGQRYDVRFDLNRLVFRRMHQALATAFIRPQILFPVPGHVTTLFPLTTAQQNAVRCVDRKVGSNPPQLQAVTAILHRPLGSVPFIIYGPPGTGKTVTVVESIRQILLGNPSARILACAPSNSASDIIAERLADLGKTQIFRLISPTRNKNTVPAAVLPITLTATTGDFTSPPVDELIKFRVVVITCFSASVPHGIGVPRGHFTHIFIDEAGQAQEPELMIPIKTMADNNTIVVLSGDCKQLGPIVRAPVARDLGLGTSYLDRLMTNPVYDEISGRGTTLVKLTKNWRSHSSILKFPNEEFYRSELEACGDPAVTHSLLRWDMLPTSGFPVIFHGVAGQDTREASSPSFFNIEEASLVKKYVQDLLGDRRLRLGPQNIGVVSPYNAQVRKIRMLLRAALPTQAKELKVGSVEEFQGQERRVIIVSTVRSSVDLVQFDLRHTLGFVANPRRFNVAMTRAQALLVVIGDPLVLSLDPLWKSFINYIHGNGGCTGMPIDWDPMEVVDRSSRFDEMRRETARTEMQELIERTKSLVIGQAEDLTGRDDIDELEGNTDKPWREDD